MASLSIVDMRVVMVWSRSKDWY